MNDISITNNSFLRQYETTVAQSLAKIEYAAQERKIFLTKLVIPSEIKDPLFKEAFIRAVLEDIKEMELRVVPTSPEIASFVKKNRRYKEMLPIGIRIEYSAFYRFTQACFQAGFFMRVLEGIQNAPNHLSLFL